MVNIMLCIFYNKKREKPARREKMQDRNENTDRMEQKSTEKED